MIFKPDTTNRFTSASFRWIAGGLVLIALFPLPRARASSVDPLMLRAYRFYMAGRYRQAESLYYRICRRAPRDAGAFYGVGACEYNRRNLSTAKAYLQKAVELDPGLRKARVLLEMTQKVLTARQVRDLRFILLMAEGVLNFRTHHYRKAESILKKAALLKPDSADLHFNLGLVYLKLKKWDQAQSELEECLKLKPRDKKAEYALGVVYEKVGAMSLAKDYFLNVATSPDAGVYNWDAMHRLSHLHSDIDGNAPFHFLLLLQGGGSENTPDRPLPGNPAVTNRTINEYGHLQLSFSPWLGKPDINFSYFVDGIWSQGPGQSPFFADMHDFSANANIHLSNWTLPLNFDEQIGLYPSGDLFYQHHQGSAAIQWRFLGSDTLQAQVQYMRELLFPIGTDNWIASFSSAFVLGPHLFNLSYSYRESREDGSSIPPTGPDYSYTQNSISLTYLVQFGGGWSATAGYNPQWTDYPHYELNGGPRYDWIQGLGGSFTIPVTPHWNFVLGGQYQWNQSTDPGSSNRSGTYYTAAEIFY